MKLSVIVPVFNEARTIRHILAKVRAVPIEKEIIVVDGGSFDGTCELLEIEAKEPDTRILEEYERRGRGHAIRIGLEVATGDIVIFQDADLELDPNDYPALLKPIEQGNCDVVFGSRFLSGKPLMTPLQHFGNSFLTYAVNFLYSSLLQGNRLTDVETCYQVFRREAVQGMPLRSDHFAFTVELTAKLIKRKRRIIEIPIRYIPRGRIEGKKVCWGDGFASLWALIKYRFVD